MIDSALHGQSSVITALGPQSHDPTACLFGALNPIRSYDCLLDPKLSGSVIGDEFTLSDDPHLTSFADFSSLQTSSRSNHTALVQDQSDCYSESSLISDGGLRISEDNRQTSLSLEHYADVAAALKASQQQQAASPLLYLYGTSTICTSDHEETRTYDLNNETELVNVASSSANNVISKNSHFIEHPSSVCLHQHDSSNRGRSSSVVETPAHDTQARGQLLLFDPGSLLSPSPSSGPQSSLSPDDSDSSRCHHHCNTPEENSSLLPCQRQQSPSYLSVADHYSTTVPSPSHTMSDIANQSPLSRANDSPRQLLSGGLVGPSSATYAPSTSLDGNNIGKTNRSGVVNGKRSKKSRIHHHQGDSEIASPSDFESKSEIVAYVEQKLEAMEESFTFKSATYQTHLKRFLPRPDDKHRKYIERIDSFPRIPTSAAEQRELLNLRQVKRGMSPDSRLGDGDGLTIKERLDEMLTSLVNKIMFLLVVKFDTWYIHAPAREQIREQLLEFIWPSLPDLHAFFREHFTLFIDMRIRHFRDSVARYFRDRPRTDSKSTASATGANAYGPTVPQQQHASASNNNTTPTGATNIGAPSTAGSSSLFSNRDSEDSSEYESSLRVPGHLSHSNGYSRLATTHRHFFSNHRDTSAAIERQQNAYTNSKDTLLTTGGEVQSQSSITADNSSFDFQCPKVPLHSLHFSPQHRQPKQTHVSSYAVPPIATSAPVIFAEHNRRSNPNYHYDVDFVMNRDPKRQQLMSDINVHCISSASVTNGVVNEEDSRLIRTNKRGNGVSNSTLYADSHMLDHHLKTAGTNNGSTKDDTNNDSIPFQSQDSTCNGSEGAPSVFKKELPLMTSSLYISDSVCLLTDNSYTSVKDELCKGLYSPNVLPQQETSTQHSEGDSSTFLSAISSPPSPRGAQDRLTTASLLSSERSEFTSFAVTEVSTDDRLPQRTSDSTNTVLFESEAMNNASSHSQGIYDTKNSFNSRSSLLNQPPSFLLYQIPSNKLNQPVSVGSIGYGATVSSLDSSRFGTPTSVVTLLPMTVAAAAATSNHTTGRLPASKVSATSTVAAALLSSPLVSPRLQGATDDFTKVYYSMHFSV